MTDETPEQELELLSADDIFGMDDLEPITLAVPEWDRGDKKGAVRLRPLSAAEIMAYIEKNKKGSANGPVDILVMSAVDINGKPLFQNKREILDRVAKKSMKALTRIQAAAMKLNGLDQDEKDAIVVKNG